MAESKLYGIKLDSINDFLTKQLCKKARITVQNFKKSDISDSFFDVVIGNVTLVSSKKKFTTLYRF